MPLKLNSAGGGSVTLDVPSTASNFTLTAPGITDTIVTKTSTDTLTNKTLTSPNITSPTFSSISPLFIPRYTLYYDNTSSSQTNPSSIVKTATASHVSWGTIMYCTNKGMGSLCFEMTVTCSTPTTVSSYLLTLDDNVYFWLNGTNFASSTGAGQKNLAVSWNLVSGTNLIQIVLNNSGGGGAELNFFCDFFKNGVTLFVPPV